MSATVIHDDGETEALQSLDVPESGQTDRNRRKIRTLRTLISNLERANKVFRAWHRAKSVRRV